MKNYKDIVNQFDTILETSLVHKTVLTIGLIDGIQYRTYVEYNNVEVAKEVQKRINYFKDIK